MLRYAGRRPLDRLGPDREESEFDSTQIEIVRFDSVQRRRQVDQSIDSLRQRTVANSSRVSRMPSGYFLDSCRKMEPVSTRSSCTTFVRSPELSSHSEKLRLRSDRELGLPFEA